LVGTFFRLLLKALLPVGLILGGFAYYAQLQGQDPLTVLRNPAQTIPALSLQGLQSLQSGLAGIVERHTGDSQPRTVYRWEDAAGAVFYGQTPPADARAVRALRIDTTAAADGLADGVADGSAERPVADGGLRTRSPAPDELLFDDARALRETLRQRQRADDKLFGG